MSAVGEFDFSLDNIFNNFYRVIAREEDEG
jgi:hypothetical protein